MGLHRPGRDDQPTSNLGIGMTDGKELEDLLFAFGQVWVVTAHEMHRLGTEAWIYERFPGPNGQKCPEQFVFGGRSHQITRRALCQGGRGDPRVEGVGQHEDPSFGMSICQAWDRHPILAGEPEVRDDHIGSKQPDEGTGPGEVTGLPYDRYRGLGIRGRKDMAQPGPIYRSVTRDDDPQRPH